MGLNLPHSRYMEHLSPKGKSNFIILCPISIRTDEKNTGLQGLEALAKKQALIRVMAASVVCVYSMDAQIALLKE